MNTPLTRRPDGNGASAEADTPAAVPSAAGVAAGYLLPGTWRGVGSQAAAALGMLTGLWGASCRGSSPCSTPGATPPPST